MGSLANHYRDYLSHLKVRNVEDPMFLLIDAQQKALTKRHGFAALPLLLILECKELGIPLSDVLGYALNALAHLESTDTQKLRAIRAYIANEMEEE